MMKRSPIVAVLGHVDHGKSTLLDFIRKSNVADSEAGGITQRIGAYEVVREDGKITFIDTPGHAAFEGIRARSASVADVAVLVVAADDGVKPQTIEALRAIEKAGIPYIVGINKIDKPGASVDRTKQSLAENGLYVEGYGGNIPSVAISAKTGEGVDALLDLIVLASDLEELTAAPEKDAKGVVIETHHDKKRGVIATVIVRDGTLRIGDFIVADNELAVVRRMTDAGGLPRETAGPGTPVEIMGFAKPPDAGAPFSAFKSKKDAEKSLSPKGRVVGKMDRPEKEMTVPILLKADTYGVLEALEGELGKRETDKVGVKIVVSGIGNITEGDIKLALGNTRPLIICFAVEIDKPAKDLAERHELAVQQFDIIYKLTEWFDGYIERISPKETKEVLSGQAKILKTFSRSKEKQVVGGSVVSGALEKGKRVRITRRENAIGEGKIVNLQKSRVDVAEVAEGEQFGAVIESKTTIAAGDTLETVSAE